MRLIDPLIIGGGPAGSAAAIALAGAGAKPLILERNRETGDAICGGFLSWRTLETLERLGLGTSDLQGHNIDELRLLAGTVKAVARLPKAAIGISRQRLDSLLLAKAESLGAKVERGVSVREYLPESKIRTADGTMLEADSLFLGNGKYDLRGCARPHDDNQTLGLRVKAPPHPALTRLVGNSIELHLFEGGYCGILLNEAGAANICMAVRKWRLAASDGDPAKLLMSLAVAYPALGERLAYASAATPDAISAVPYGWIAASTTPGLFRLGDQAAVIPSLAGEGNGIALASGIAAAKAWQDGGANAAPAYQKRFAAATHYPVGSAMRLWHWGERPFAAKLATRMVSLFPKLGAYFATMTRIMP